MSFLIYINGFLTINCAIIKTRLNSNKMKMNSDTKGIYHATPHFNYDHLISIMALKNMTFFGENDQNLDLN
jgi:hypothetical protein